MKTVKTAFFAVLTMLLMSSCAPSTSTRAPKFPLMYEENPLCILILPPINESTAADAKEYYSTTIQEPLAFLGYYTIPYPISQDLLKMEGIYDSELLADTPLEKFKEYFGADAVLFTTIRKWDLSYMVLASNLIVSVDCRLKSTTTNRVLWRNQGTVVVDLSGSNVGGGIAGLVASVITTAVNSAAADYVPYARQANYKALATLPAGRYRAMHNKARETGATEQAPEQAEDSEDSGNAEPPAPVE